MWLQSFVSAGLSSPEDYSAVVMPADISATSDVYANIEIITGDERKLAFDAFPSGVFFTLSGPETTQCYRLTGGAVYSLQGPESTGMADVKTTRVFVPDAFALYRWQFY